MTTNEYEDLLGLDDLKAPELLPGMLHGDCIEVMRGMPENSVDSIVTDPPYGLGFMGKKWDALPPGEEWARECLRVLKPGGHLIAFGGSRTWHRLAVAIEDAGFEIRDGVLWLYGSGFPKSHDISKAIDKTRDDSEGIREVCRWLRARLEEHPTETVRTLAERFGFHPRMVEHWAARDTDSQPALPKPEQWDALKSVLGFSDEKDSEVLRLNLRKGEPGESWKARPVTGVAQQWEDRTNYAITSRDGLLRDKPATPEAQQWEGWGTALKPAYEPAVMARKPFLGTVAGNVLEHGTGAINIDACRIGTETRINAPAGNKPGGASYNMSAKGMPADAKPTEAQGRFPANLILDEHTAELLDEQSGITKSSDKPRKNTAEAHNKTSSMGKSAGDWETKGHSDSGGASRFFYVAKAPKSERPVVDGVAHATVKPLTLMRYLVRMVTPPGGIVLDPFGGSGTTAEAALLEGFQFKIIERERDYLPLIRARIERATKTLMEDLL